MSDYLNKYQRKLMLATISRVTKTLPKPCTAVLIKDKPIVKLEYDGYEYRFALGYRALPITELDVTYFAELSDDLAGVIVFLGPRAFEPSEQARRLVGLPATGEVGWTIGNCESVDTFQVCSCPHRSKEALFTAKNLLCLIDGTELEPRGVKK